MSSSRTFKTDQLAEFLAQLLTGTGVYAYDATDCANRILEADILGEEEHGLASVPRHLETARNGDIDPRAMVMTESETPAVAFLNGNQGMGHVAGTKAVSMAVEKAKAVGTGTIVVGNSQDFGSPAVYARLIAMQGYVGYVTTSICAKPSFTPPGSDAPKMGRHEFVCAFPFGPEKIAFSKGASRNCESEQAMLLGSSLSLMNSVLTCALAGAKMPVNKTRGSSLEHTEHFFLAIDPSQFGGTEKFDKRLTDGLELIQLDGSILRTAGKDLPESIPVSDTVFGELSELATKYKAQLPS